MSDIEENRWKHWQVWGYEDPGKLDAKHRRFSWLHRASETAFRAIVAFMVIRISKESLEKLLERKKRGHR